MTKSYGTDWVECENLQYWTRRSDDHSVRISSISRSSSTVNSQLMYSLGTKNLGLRTQQSIEPERIIGLWAIPDSREMVRMAVHLLFLVLLASTWKYCSGENCSLFISSRRCWEFWQLSIVLVNLSFPIKNWKGLAERTIQANVMDRSLEWWYLDRCSFMMEKMLGNHTQSHSKISECIFITSIVGLNFLARSVNRGPFLPAIVLYTH